MNPVKLLRYIAGFVRLDGTDEVPYQRQVRKFGDLGQGFLHVVFTEFAQAGRVRGANIVCGAGFADGKYKYVTISAMAIFRTRPYPIEKL